MRLFIDETERIGYGVCMIAIAASKVAESRRAMRGLLVKGQRALHFSKQQERRRRTILTAIAGLEVEALIAFAPARTEADRRDCLERLLRHGTVVGAECLWIESRDAARDNRDKAMLEQFRRRGIASEITYRHVKKHEEPLLWIPDAIAWSYTRSSEWKRRARDSARILEL